MNKDNNEDSNVYKKEITKDVLDTCATSSSGGRVDSSFLLSSSHYSTSLSSFDLADSRSIVCQEVLDQHATFTTQELEEYAVRLGIDVVNEKHLLLVAEEGLRQPLPPEWKPCWDAVSNAYYYFNFATGVSQWSHPLDFFFTKKVELARIERLVQDARKTNDHNIDTKVHRDRSESLRESDLHYSDTMDLTNPSLKGKLAPLKGVGDQLSTSRNLPPLKKTSSKSKLLRSESKSSKRDVQHANGSVKKDRTMSKGKFESPIGSATMLRRSSNVSEEEESEVSGNDLLMESQPRSTSLARPRGILKDKEMKSNNNKRIHFDLDDIVAEELLAPSNNVNGDENSTDDSDQDHEEDPKIDNNNKEVQLAVRHEASALHCHEDEDPKAIAIQTSNEEEEDCIEEERRQQSRLSALLSTPISRSSSSSSSTSSETSSDVPTSNKMNRTEESGQSDFNVLKEVKIDPMVLQESTLGQKQERHSNSQNDIEATKTVDNLTVSEVEPRLSKCLEEERRRMELELRKVYTEELERVRAALQRDLAIQERRTRESIWNELRQIREEMTKSALNSNTGNGENHVDNGENHVDKDEVEHHEVDGQSDVEEVDASSFEGRRDSEVSAKLVSGEASILKKLREELSSDLRREIQDIHLKLASNKDRLAMRPEDNEGPRVTSTRKAAQVSRHRSGDAGENGVRRRRRSRMPNEDRVHHTLRHPQANVVSKKESRKTSKTFEREQKRKSNCEEVHEAEELLQRLLRLSRPELSKSATSISKMVRSESSDKGEYEDEDEVVSESESDSSRTRRRRPRQRGRTRRDEENHSAANSQSTADSSDVSESLQRLQERVQLLERSLMPYQLPMAPPMAMTRHPSVMGSRESVLTSSSQQNLLQMANVSSLSVEEQVLQSKLWLKQRQQHLAITKPHL